MGTALAIVGSAVVGAVASKSASKSAAKGQERALEATGAAAEAAKFDINRLFGKAEETREAGFGRTLDFLAGAPERQIDPFQRGSRAAQETTAAGLPQVQRAILGLPTDLSRIKPRSIEGDFNIPVPERTPAAPPSQDQQLADLIARISGSVGGAFSGGRGISIPQRVF